MIEDKVRILIVEARFYSDLADEMLRAATDVITAHGADYDVISVPGALEIPGAIAIAEEGGHRQKQGASQRGVAPVKKTGLVQDAQRGGRRDRVGPQADDDPPFEHGPEGVRFYTRMKAITQRWGANPGAEFSMPQIGR